MKQQKIKIQQIKSAIGQEKSVKATILGLGFKRLNSVVEVLNNESTLGMINKVKHLIRIL
jgi:large subunit ribosomal protein L30